HTRSKRDWSSDVCSSDLAIPLFTVAARKANAPANPATTSAYSTGASRAALSDRDPVTSHRIAPARDHQAFDGFVITGALLDPLRSEERRVGKEGRPRGGM